MRVGAASFIASIVLVAVACGGHVDLNPPCTIGKPCEIEIDAGYTSNGQPCVGAPPYDNEQPSCICICPAGSDDAGAEANEIPDSSATPEAGVCGSGPAGECNQLANIGTVITPTCIAGTAPAMNGGAIADGTYVLVSGTAYASSCSGVSLPTGGALTILVSAGCMQSIDTTDGAQTYTWTTSGNAFVLDQVCPGMFSADVQYAATPTALSWLQPFTAGVSLVSVFQKR